MDKLYIIMPVYNEEAVIRQTVLDWYDIIEQLNQSSADRASRLVVVNDGSRDKTGDILTDMAADLPYMSVLHKENSGHGPSLIYGYRYALHKGADYIFQTDSDGQTDPKEFQDFWNLRNRYDAVFGNRTQRGDGAQRAFVERVLCRMLRCFFYVSIPDANAPFRLMTHAYVKTYLKRMPRDYSLPNVMLTVFGVCENRRILFVPISFQPRQAGTSSVNFIRMTRIGIRSIRDFQMFRHQMKKWRQHERNTEE